jgi:hypothetical protein
MIRRSLVRPLLAVVLLVMSLVLAASSVGAGARSGQELLACTEPPAKPTLVSPANNSTVDPNNIVLRWSAVEGATQYTGQVCEQPDCANPAGETTVTGTSFDLTAAAGTMPNDTCAYWRVRAENDCGNSGYTSVWKFCSPTTITRTPTPGDTPTDTLTPSITPTPTETLTPSITPTPSNTLTPSLTPTPSNTLTPSKTPTRTNTPQGRYIYGEVRDVDTDQPLEGVVVTLYRNESGSWTQLNQKTTDENGNYAFGFSPVSTLHRIVETDPYDYMSDHVSLPSGFSGTVVNANTVEFEPPSTGSVGPLVFYDRHLPTATRTNTPTVTPTSTQTPTATATEGATPTPTMTSEILKVWLPMILNRFVD